MRDRALILLGFATAAAALVEVKGEQFDVNGLHFGAPSCWDSTACFPPFTW
jgi:hypothetical protein